jgi:hypothetical protein
VASDTFRGATTAADVLETTLGAVTRIVFTPLGGARNRESAPVLLC